MRKGLYLLEHDRNTDAVHLWLFPADAPTTPLREPGVATAERVWNSRYWDVRAWHGPRWQQQRATLRSALEALAWHLGYQYVRHIGLKLIVVEPRPNVVLLVEPTEPAGIYTIGRGSRVPA